MLGGFSAVFFIHEEESYITNHLVTGSEGNGEFCFPKNLDVSQVKVKGNIEI